MGLARDQVVVGVSTLVFGDAAGSWLRQPRRLAWLLRRASLSPVVRAVYRGDGGPVGVRGSVGLGLGGGGVVEVVRPSLDSDGETTPADQHHRRRAKRTCDARNCKRYYALF